MVCSPVEPFRRWTLPSLSFCRKVLASLEASLRTGTFFSSSTLFFFFMSPTYEEGYMLILVWIPSALALAWLDTFLSAQYLVKQWLDSYQIFMDT